MAIEVGCHRPTPIPPTPSLGCICRQVQRIDQIQKEALLEESCLSCNTPRLGENIAGRRVFNTRPFSLYLPNGERLSIVVDDFTPFTVDINTEEVNIENQIPENNTENLNSQTIRGRNMVPNNSTNAIAQRSNPVRISNQSRRPNRANVFRVESIEGCCAVLRALVPRGASINTLGSGRPRNRFEATCFCCTVDLNDFVCIQCFEDTYVNLGSCFE